MRKAPAPFCAMSYFNDPQYLPKDVKGKEILKLKLRERDPKLKEAAGKSTASCKTQQVLQVVSTGDVKLGEKLFADYGIMYVFSRFATRNFYSQKKVRTRKF